MLDRPEAQAEQVVVENPEIGRSSNASANTLAAVKRFNRFNSPVRKNSPALRIPASVVPSAIPHRSGCTCALKNSDSAKAS
jgi:hypothetical protein